LSPYALLTLLELKEHVGAGGSAKDATLTEIINRVTTEIEGHLARQIVTRGALVEFHTMRDCSSELLTQERPIIAVTTIHEDLGLPRTYGAAALLVNDTDYQLVKPRGLVRRLQGLGLPIEWALGLRAIKIVYTAGYATAADAPASIRGVAFGYAALAWSETKRGDFGVSGASDALGNYTRFAPAQLTPQMKDALADERRHWTPTGERDA